MMLQQTVAAPVEINGQALHSGATVNMRICPQPVNTGICFRRIDLPGASVVKADINRVTDTKKSLTIGCDGWGIATIEHLMAVFHGLGVDNALVEVDGAELPLGDGSGLYFAERMLRAGLESQTEPRHHVSVQEPVWVEGTVNKGDHPSKAALVLLPGTDRLEVSFTFTSDHKVTGTQFYHFVLEGDRFMREIAPARTIAFTRELAYLRSMGLALSDDYSCAVVVGDEGYEGDLRFPDEIVRHKILDILGDFYLLGPLTGHFIAVRSGHALDYELARKIAVQTAAVR